MIRCEGILKFTVTCIDVGTIVANNGMRISSLVSHGLVESGSVTCGDETGRVLS